MVCVYSAKFVRYNRIITVFKRLSTHRFPEKNSSDLISMSKMVYIYFIQFNIIVHDSLKYLQFK